MGIKKKEKEIPGSNKLGCASVKLLVWLEFTKALSNFITKRISDFFFQIGKIKYEPIFGIIILRY